MSNDTLVKREAPQTVYEFICTDEFESRAKAFIPDARERTSLVSSLKQALARNEEFRKAHPKSAMGASIVAAAAQALEIRLSLSTHLQQAFLIPRGGKCYLEIGYRGYLALAQRSPFFVSANAAPVFHGDILDESNGTEPYLRHSRKFATTEIMAAWATITVVRAGQMRSEYTLLGKEEIAKARGMGNSSTWNKWGEEFSRKTAMRRLLKYAALDVEALDKAQAIDDEAEISNVSAVQETFKEVKPIAQSEPGEEPDLDLSIPDELIPQ